MLGLGPNRTTRSLRQVGSWPGRADFDYALHQVPAKLNMSHECRSKRSFVSK
jgi:hypothetical protein